MHLYPRWAALTAAIKDHNNDPNFMGQLAVLDLRTPFGQRVAQRFPEYFSEEREDGGPIPLSVVRQVAERNGRASNAKNPADFPQSFGAHEELNIPLVEYAIEGCEQGGWSVARDGSVPSMPDELRSATTQGDVVTLGDRKLVLVEYNNEPGVGIAYFASIDRVDPAC